MDFENRYSIVLNPKDGNNQLIIEYKENDNMENHHDFFR